VYWKDSNFLHLFFPLTLQHAAGKKLEPISAQ